MLMELKMMWAGYVARKGMLRRAYETSVEKSGGKSLHGRRGGGKWEDNIKNVIK